MQCEASSLEIQKRTGPTSKRLLMEAHNSLVPTKREQYVLVIICCISLLTACGSHSIIRPLTLQAAAVTPGFSLSTSSNCLTLEQGASASLTVTLEAQNGFDEQVNLSVSGLPNGIAAKFTPATVWQRSVLNIASSDNAIAGNYQITLSGAAGGIQRSLPLTVTVLPSSPSFTVSVYPLTLSIDQGMAGASTVTVGAQNGFSGRVGLSVTGLPSGATAIFQPDLVNGSGTSALLVSLALTTLSGSYELAISGTNASFTQSTEVTLVVSPVSPRVSLNVLSFPGASGDPYFRNDLSVYLYGNSTVAGATIAIEWAGSDPGTGQYDWSYPDSQIRPWIQAGKRANLVVWAVADNSADACGAEGQFGQSGIGNCAIPAYVWNALGSSNITACTSQYGTQQMPNYFAETFQSNYESFMAALIQHYALNPGIGYIRFGLGHGGESLPVGGWNDLTTICGQAYVQGWGLSVQSWEEYLDKMLSYERSLASPLQLLLGVTPMGDPGKAVPDYAAPIAVQNGIGFGSQGLEATDVNDCAGSTANWCSLFNEYAGLVPLELQTMGQSCPSGGCTTGSLTDLIPFAVSNHATILEIYYQDWLTAFDPRYPGYFPEYQTTLQVASGDVN
jgi:hypothetical protein